MTRPDAYVFGALCGDTFRGSQTDPHRTHDKFIASEVICHLGFVSDNNLVKYYKSLGKLAVLGSTMDS